MATRIRICLVPLELSADTSTSISLARLTVYTCSAMSFLYSLSVKSAYNKTRRLLMHLPSHQGAWLLLICSSLVIVVVAVECSGLSVSLWIALTIASMNDTQIISTHDSLIMYVHYICALYMRIIYVLCRHTRESWGTASWR